MAVAGGGGVEVGGGAVEAIASAIEVWTSLGRRVGGDGWEMEGVWVVDGGGWVESEGRGRAAGMKGLGTRMTWQDLAMWLS